MRTRTAFSTEEDEIISNAINNRAEGTTMLSGLESAMHLLPGRNRSSCMVRYYNKLRPTEPTATEPATGSLVQQLQNVLDDYSRMRSENDALQTSIERLKTQIKTYEDDQAAFLKLMDKARTIGREEYKINA